MTFLGMPLGRAWRCLLLHRTTVSRQAHSWGHCGRGRQPTSSWPREEDTTCWSVRDLVSLGKSLGPSEQWLFPDTALATSTASFYYTPLTNTNRNEDFWSGFQIKTDLRWPILPQTQGGPRQRRTQLPLFFFYYNTVSSCSPWQRCHPLAYTGKAEHSV